MNIAEQILELKDRLQESKENQIAVRTKLDSMMERLKTEFNCFSIEEANMKLKKLSDELEVVQQELNDAINKFEEEYPLD